MKFPYKDILSRLTLLVAVSFFALATMSCHDDVKPEKIEPPVIEETGRTVLVYMLSSNNGLGASRPYDYDMQDIDEMVKAAREGGIRNGRLIIFHSSSNDKQILKEVSANGTIDTLKVYDASIVPQSTVRMTEVLDDMKALAPALDYGLILWGHGTGWIEDGLNEDSRSDIQTYSYGSEMYDSRKMNITSLASALEGRDFSFVYFDCCYMASVEVAYQLRKVTPWLVVYPTEILAYGMPYDRNVKHFFAEEPELEQAARNTFDFYDRMTNPKYRMCTVSVINTVGLDRLAAATRAIYEGKSTGVPADYTPQRYTTANTYHYCDLGGYVNALKADAEQKAEFDAALADVVKLELATEKIWGWHQINEHSGLSTFIMSSDADAAVKNYCRLDWFTDVASSLIH